MDNEWIRDFLQFIAAVAIVAAAAMLTKSMNNINSNSKCYLHTFQMHSTNIHSMVDLTNK